MLSILIAWMLLSVGHRALQVPVRAAQPAAVQAPSQRQDLSGVLEGRLVDPLGEPVRGFVLTAYAEALLPALRPEGIVPAGASSTIGGEPGREVSALTDARGRFRMQGLAPGRFFFQILRWQGSERGAQLEPTLYTTGGEAVLLVLTLHRLELDVPGGAEPFCYQLEPYARSDFDCGPLLERSQIFERGTPRGRYSLRVGATYAVGLWSPGRGLVEERFVAGAGGVCLHRPALSLPAATPRGIVELTICCERSSVPIHARLLAPLSRHVLLDERMQSPAPGELHARLELPAGRYLVRASEVEPFGFEPQLWQRFELVEAERAILVESGKTTALQLELAGGGRLGLLVQAPDAETVLVRCRGPESSGWRLLEFEPHFGGIVVGRLTALQPGKRRASRHPLAPGRHVLRIEAEGFEPRTVEVVIEDGRDLELEVALEPR